METIFQWLYALFFLWSVGNGQLAYPSTYDQYEEQDSAMYSEVLTVEDIIRYADQLDFSDPKLIASIAQIESSIDPDATNHHKGVTYYGLMQISYGTAVMVGFKGSPEELMDWHVNVKYAAKYLKQLLAEHKTIRKAVAAYNAGTVIPCKKKCPKGHVVNQKYVDKVMATYKGLKRRAVSSPT